MEPDLHEALRPNLSGRLLQVEVLAALKEAEAHSVDLIIADPGYGLGKGDWDAEPDFGPWVKEARRVLNRFGTAYIFGLPEAVAGRWDAFPAPKRLLTWHVTNRVSPACRTWQSTQESIVMFWTDRPYFDREAAREPYGAEALRHRGKSRPGTPGRFGRRPSRFSAAPGALPRDVLKGPGLSGWLGRREGLGHPCQKPLWLMERLIRASCPPGGLVLDLFAGVGTASVAAQRLGRRWIAVEKDPKWADVARLRLGGPISGEPIFLGQDEGRSDGAI